MKVDEIYDPEESAKTRVMVDKIGTMFQVIEQAAKSGMRMDDPQMKDEMFQRILDILQGRVK